MSEYEVLYDVPESLAGLSVASPNILITSINYPALVLRNSSITVIVGWKNIGDGGNMRINIAEKLPDGTWKFLKGMRIDGVTAGQVGTAQITIPTPSTGGVWNLRAVAGYLTDTTLTRTDTELFTITVEGPPPTVRVQPLIIVAAGSALLALILWQATK